MSGGYGNEAEDEEQDEVATRILTSIKTDSQSQMVLYKPTFLSI